MKTAARLTILAAAGLLGACNSPNRGEWTGSFGGSVSGTVEFTINARGTALTGKMEGQTTDGAPFHAEMEGKITDRYFYATFEGRTDTGLRPIPFEGLMKGELADGKGSGEWDAKIRFTEIPMNGTWSAEQNQ